jgi:serine/threonine protein kinase
MTIRGDIVHGCIFTLNIVYFVLRLDQLGDALGSGTFGIVRKAVYLNSGNEYAIKISNLELENYRRVADVEKNILERLKGFSPYLVDLVECFDEVYIS